MLRIVFSILLTTIIIVGLLIGVSELPEFGDPDNPAHNYVSKRYVEKGVEEAGGLNIVTDIILDYRAFDTFGEATVLFTGVIAVMVVLNRKDER
ncbi:multicomponent Na+:H+ antiporter subunit B [Anaerosolibacter carboniphilus]|uniref:Multicomponent Na+:H+ antiporter subunit B n=1 Tax=Anaerosolibacter carboniphilus TaxID=1417629 RepID=A0A841KJ93_9FIRM|nr:hydrogen gas-evolving membrane-bound hydrogenase subunit E [Anaerosolibacter carboniphilus]MBB6213944.1 multicomponent Na+:H+ antiporter subunit B [Anaerosolibacter carboniphilus]